MSLSPFERAAVDGDYLMEHQALTQHNYDEALIYAGFTY